MNGETATRTIDLARLTPLRRATLVASAAAFVGAALLALVVFVVAVPFGRPREAAGAASGGAAGLLLGAIVFRSWVSALLRARGPADGRVVWRAFGRGFALKAVVLVVGTAVVRFAVPALSPAGFAVAFAAGALWVSVLGVPFLHRQLGSSRGL